MKINSKMFAVIGMTVTLMVSTLTAQTESPQISIPVAVGGDDVGVGSTLVSSLPFDISMLTNRASLVSYCLKKVAFVGVEINASSSTQEPVKSQFAYTDKVKTLEGIMRMIGGAMWDIPLVSTNDTIRIFVTFSDTDEKSYVGQTLFKGVGGGQPSAGRLASEVSMYMAQNIFVPMSNVWSARLIFGNDNIGYEGMPIATAYQNGQLGISFPAEHAGRGLLALQYTEYDPSHGWWVVKDKVLDLSNGGKEVPINHTLVNVILRDSEDFRSSIDQWDLDTYVWSWQGYGKIPLLTPTYTKPTIVHLRVWTGKGNNESAWATTFSIEDLETGQKSSVVVPAGTNEVWITLPKGSYHINPLGLDLKTWGELPFAKG